MIGRNSKIFDVQKGTAINAPHSPADSTVKTGRNSHIVSKSVGLPSRGQVGADASRMVTDAGRVRHSRRFSSRRGVPSVVVGVVLVVLLLRQVNGQSVLAHVKGIHVRYLWLAVTCSLAGFALRAWRWRFLLRAIQNVRFSRLLAAELVGFTANSLFPFRLGEALKGLTVSRLEGIPLST